VIFWIEFLRTCYTIPSSRTRQAPPLSTPVTLDDRLDAYPLLPPDERAAVERDVEAAPHLASRLAEARVLAATLDAAAPGAPVTADDVARRETDRLLGHATPDADRIAAAVAADDALAAEAERARARLAGWAAAAEPPAAHFARLMAAHGASLPAATEADGRTTARADRPAADRATDRTAAAPPRARRAPAFRRLVLAMGVVAVAYGAAFTGSSLMVPERDRVAALAEVGYVAPVVRGGDAPGDQAARLTAALDAVAGARRTTLGLFPRYDVAALDAAAADLDVLIASADPASVVSQEARLALGRVRLQQGRDADAARVLGTLVAGESYRAPEARRLLDWIRTR